MADNRQAGERPIDAALARHLKGEAGPGDEAAVRDWRRSTPENDAEVAELIRLVEWSARVPALVDVPPRPSAAELIGKAGAGARVIPLSRRPSRWRGVALAAAAAAVALVGSSVYYRAAVHRAAAPAYGIRKIVTSATETATLELVDGTVIRLAPSSQLRVLDAQGRREVSLEGRSFFAVTRQNGTPFIIRTAAGEVTVLGTRFDVEARGRDLRLVVVEGRVALSTQRQRVELTAGQMSRVVDGETEPAVRVPDVASFVEWTGRFLAFQSTPLRDAAREIERVYRVRVEIANDEVGQRMITAWFWEKSLEEVLDVVCLAVAARCTAEAGVVRVQP